MGSHRFVFRHVEGILNKMESYIRKLFPKSSEDLCRAKWIPAWIFMRNLGKKSITFSMIRQTYKIFSHNVKGIWYIFGHGNTIHMYLFIQRTQYTEYHQGKGSCCVGENHLSQPYNSGVEFGKQLIHNLYAADINSFGR